MIIGVITVWDDGFTVYEMKSRSTPHHVTLGIYQGCNSIGHVIFGTLMPDPILQTDIKSLASVLLMQAAQENGIYSIDDCCFSSSSSIEGDFALWVLRMLQNLIGSTEMIAWNALIPLLREYLLGVSRLSIGM